MDMVMSSVMCATADDEPRIREIIQKMVDNDEVTGYKAFTSESKKKQVARKKKADREAKMAEKMAEELGLKNDG
jgi:DnaJ family protein C protein 9